MKTHRHFVHTQIKNHFSSKEKKDYPFLHIALASMLQVPDETLTELPVVSITGQHRIHIEHYTSVLTYETEKIVLLCPKVSMTILGEHLKIVRLNPDEIQIDGCIQNIAYH